MKNDPTLALSDADRRACLWRSGIAGAIGAVGLIVVALCAAYSGQPAQPVQAEAPDTYKSELAGFAGAIERSGNLSGLEVLW